MLPQLDFAFYSSQFFWLLVCLGVLASTFRFVFVPRLATLLSKRENVISDGRRCVAELENEISKLKAKIEEAQDEKLRTCAEIISEAERKGDAALKAQLTAIQTEGKVQSGALRKEFVEEVSVFDKKFGEEVAVSAKVLFNYLYPGK
jgi:F0F1-type ATP synthase membrane subunit b/b'